MTRYYPIALNVEGRRAVVVGGGAVARRKVETLRECGALVRVVAPELDERLEQLARRGEIESRRGDYQAADLDGAFLVIAATNSAAVNARVAADARAAGVLLNSADAPEVSDFLVSAGVRRGDLLISVFTGGHSPALSRRIREQLEAVFGPEYELLVALLGRLRPEVIAALPTDRERARVWQQILDSEVLELLRAGRAAAAEARAREIVVGAQEAPAGSRERADQGRAEGRADPAFPGVTDGQR